MRCRELFLGTGIVCPESIEDVEARWTRYRETGELDWWLSKSPNFYMFEIKE